MTEFIRLWNDIGESRVMVLSTCADNRVTSRSMSMVILLWKILLSDKQRLSEM